jgi:hypothetical protein
MKMSTVSRVDEAHFLESLRSSCGVSIKDDEELFIYFSATKGTGAAECFVKGQDGRVLMVDAKPELFDWLYENWSKSLQTKGASWTWGWAHFAHKNSEHNLHLHNDKLTEREIVGPEHGLSWRRERFGNLKIENPPFN